MDPDDPQRPVFQMTDESSERRGCGEDGCGGGGVRVVGDCRGVGVVKGEETSLRHISVYMVKYIYTRFIHDPMLERAKVVRKRNKVVWLSSWLSSFRSTD